MYFENLHLVYMLLTTASFGVSPAGRHRWVIYTTEMNGKRTLWDVDGSMVPAEW